MALINCPEYNHQISDKALSCPNCGYPINQDINTNFLGSSKTTNRCGKCGYTWQPKK